MKVIAAYLLAVLGGNDAPDAAAVKKILTAAGVEADAANIDKVVSELKGKDVYEVIEEGKSKLSAVPSGAAPAAGGGGAAPAAAAKVEEPEEEEESEEEEMGFGLFD
eukprot:TRINITY_DN16704_c0_g1_i3.p1 TRINITY_DN16704_c0_g1~~TRINITY_DN16704_c0_g1_i3.p1  ORF type:complete len:107 (-),score=56.29 TRINITY_DN16704_c0_g1_i3:86-406(-)